MKKQTVYWVPKPGALTVLAMLFMAASAVLRVIWAAGEEGLPSSVFWFQVVLPLAANVVFMLTLLESHRDLSLIHI